VIESRGIKQDLGVETIPENLEKVKTQLYLHTSMLNVYSFLGGEEYFKMLSVC
jgi:hypothetical protein